MTLGEILSAITHRIKTLATLTVLGGLVGGGIGAYITSYGDYVASALVAIAPSPDYGTDPDRPVKIHLSLMRSNEVVSEVSRKMQMSSARVASSVRVTQEVNSSTLRIEAEHSSAERAEELAQAFLSTYLEVAQRRKQEARAANAAAYEQRLATVLKRLTQQLRALSREVKRSGASPTADPSLVAPGVSAQVEAARAEYIALINESVSASDEESLFSDAAIVQPVTEAEPVPFLLPRYALIGAVSGLLVAILIIVGQTAMASASRPSD